MNLNFENSIRENHRSIHPTLDKPHAVWFRA